MARLPRVVIPGVPHHITQRGSRRADVFFCDEDRKYYLSMLMECAEQFGVCIEAWCLMSNHVHFVAIPTEESSLARCFGKAHTMYTRRINFRENWRGFLWQGRFSSCPMDESHAMHALRYVEVNPVRAKLVRKPWRYRWSSAAYHAGLINSDPLLGNRAVLTTDANCWRSFLCEGEDEGPVEAIRRETMSGHPVGDEAFMCKLEKITGRKLTRGLPGRPRSDGSN